MKSLVLSDIHLGNTKNTTKQITDHLYAFFEYYQVELESIDCVFLSGDVYDKLLYYPSQEALIALKWLVDLANWCGRRKKKLRILEGTPSHDWKQCKVLETVIEETGIDVDFKYIDSVFVEHMSDLDTYVLYVPDEWKPTTRETVEDMKRVIREAGIVKPDMAIMHGQFRFQLPVYKDDLVFVEDEIISMVKGPIVIGHIHLPAAYKTIIVPGSFDRLAHGEEEPKGGLIVDSKTKEYFFLENKQATIFKTVTFKRITDKSLERLDKIADSLPEGSHLRLKVPDDARILEFVDKLRKRYPHITLKKTRIKKKEDDVERLLTSKQLVGVELNENTLPSLVEKKLVALGEDEMAAKSAVDMMMSL